MARDVQSRGRRTRRRQPPKADPPVVLSGDHHGDIPHRPKLSLPKLSLRKLAADTVASLRSASFSRIAQLFPWSVAAASLGVLAAIFLQRQLQNQYAYAGNLSWWAWLGLIAGLLIGVIWRWLPSLPIPRRFDRDGLKAYTLSFELGVLLLPVIAFLYVWRSPFEDTRWLSYPFLNKQWLFATYWLAVAAVLLFPHFFSYWLSRAPAPGQPSAGEPPPRSASPRALIIVLNIVLAAAVSLFFAGPPWHVDRHHRPIDFHEQVHLGPLQAIHQGYLPYIGPASTQYGPGSQIVTYAYMKLTGQFNVVGYRETNALFHLATVFVFLLVALFQLEIYVVPVALLLGLAFSPLHFFIWQSDGTLDGYYGWGNGFRYLGAIVVVPALPVLLRSKLSLRRLPWPAVALGALWGAFSWLSQENLAGIAMAGALVLALLWWSRTASPKAILNVAAGLFCGLAAFWAPVLFWYLFHGALGQFLRNFALVPRMVAKGFSNTLWSDPVDDPLYNAFRFTGPVLVLIALGAVSHFTRLLPRRALNPRQSRLLAFVMVLAVCYPASLFRSDASHLLNTTIALPFVLALAFFDLPRWSAAGFFPKNALRVAIALAAFYIYPLSAALRPRADFINPALARFQSHPDPAPPRSLDTRIPFLRATQFLQDEPVVCHDSGPMRAFLEEMSSLRTIVGNRKLYVASFPTLYPDIVYFMCDLKPGPYLFDIPTLVLNDTLLEEQLQNLKQHISEYGALIATNLDASEPVIFRQAHPNVSPIRRSFAGSDYYVLLAPEPSAPIR